MLNIFFVKHFCVFLRTVLILCLSISSNLVFGQKSIVDILSLRPPREESCEMQQKYLLNWGLSDKHLFTINPLYVYEMGLSEYHSLDTLTILSEGFSPIQFRVYDKNGRFYTGWHYCYGPLGRVPILLKDSFNIPGNLPLNKKLTLQNDLTLINQQGCFGQDLSHYDFEKYDYVILAFWASYYGRAARMMLYMLEYAINYYYSDKKILLLKVNYNGF